QNLNLITYQIKEKLDKYWPIMQETTKIAAFFDLHFKRIVYHEQSVDEILILIHTNLSTNSNTITQPSFILKWYQFIQEYASTYMSITDSDSDELIQYWETIAPPEEIFVCDWWKANQSIFSNLALMAKDYLSIMAMSIPCEQLFSLAGLTVTKTRNSLDNNNVRAILCLKSWFTENL
ncbi:8369_t:CDS:1, partial [Cetraspora pellucida]